MVPPRPPSPPSGPPRGMNFSRRKLATPLPPLPATTSMVASSTNFMVYARVVGEGGRPHGEPPGGKRELTRQLPSNKKALPHATGLLPFGNCGGPRPRPYATADVKSAGLPTDYSAATIETVCLFNAPLKPN